MRSLLLASSKAGNGLCGVAGAVLDRKALDLAAVQDDVTKLEEAIERTQHISAPTTLRRRAKGAKSRGIPLTVLNIPSAIEQGVIS